MKNIFFEIHTGVNKLSLKLGKDREHIIDPDIDHWLWHQFNTDVTLSVGSIYMEGMGVLYPNSLHHR